MVDVRKQSESSPLLCVYKCLHVATLIQTRPVFITMALTYEPHLMQLSDDVILHIMSFLNSADVYALLQVCLRLEKISKDRTLWKHADFRPKFLTEPELVKIFRVCFHLGTKFLALSGSKVSCLSPNLFDLIIQYSNLETLVLEQHFIDANMLPFTCFPSTVRHLSMTNCELVNIPLKKSYFYNMASIMPQLETLNLSGCQWFEDHSLMAISKCPKLKSLCVRNCPKVGACAAYILLAARFGFECIEVLDLRETAIGDGEIHAFQSKTSLKELYIDGRFHRKQDSHIIDRVGDRGIYVLGEFTPNLQVLTLTNTEITDVTLRHLSRNLPGLLLLDVRGCDKVTEDGVRNLRNQLPDLRILSNFQESINWSQIPPNWFIDKEFVPQVEVPRPPPVTPPSRPGPALAGIDARQERIELVFVEPGMVRIRRIVEEPPAQPQPQQAEALPPPPPQPDVIERIEFVEHPPRSPSSSND